MQIQVAITAVEVHTHIIWIQFKQNTKMTWFYAHGNLKSKVSKTLETRATWAQYFSAWHIIHSYATGSFQVCTKHAKFTQNVYIHSWHIHTQNHHKSHYLHHTVTIQTSLLKVMNFAFHVNFGIFWTRCLGRIAALSFQTSLYTHCGERQNRVHHTNNRMLMNSLLH